MKNSVTDHIYNKVQDNGGDNDHHKDEERKKEVAILLT